MSDSVRPHRQQPTRLPGPWDSPGKNTGVGCHFLLQHMKVKSESEVAQSCPTLCDPMDCRLPGSSVHGIFQARVLEWGAIAFSILELHSILYSVNMFNHSLVDEYVVFLLLQITVWRAVVYISLFMRLDCLSLHIEIYICHFQNILSC